ncbi:MAG: hypothetical protein HUJ22_02955 [Gracilimonas sp.]|uniref:hypothetical protein n=1 Tax=Gracilimonas sp. TaxID=1974203 RepID=UPI0019998737|nr:hypothetical protein [Gracilimonas sp.]MBD3615505.1 hypothetical protein [Gracilimonas sp.]
MHTDENNAIRYLMKEMDPSEEMEFEQEMREDEDLLIEVESLRATNRKLSVLPHKHPPKNLIQKVTNDAKHQQSKHIRSTTSIPFLIKRGIAAAILLSAFTGGYYYYSGLPDSAPSQTSSNTENVEPWVDRNEIIRFSEGQQTIQPTIQADLNKSYEKLQLVNDPSGNNTSGSGILLTGSPN